MLFNTLHCIPLLELLTEGYYFFIRTLKIYLIIFQNSHHHSVFHPNTTTDYQYTIAI